MGYRSSYEKFLRKEFLTRMEAMQAQCYACNGESAEMMDDCGGKETCPLYQYSPWGRQGFFPKIRKKSRLSNLNHALRHATHGENPPSRSI